MLKDLIRGTRFASMSRFLRQQRRIRLFGILASADI